MRNLSSHQLIPQPLDADLSLVAQQGSIRGQDIGNTALFRPANRRIVEQVSMAVQMNHIHIITHTPQDFIDAAREKELVSICRPIRPVGDCQYPYSVVIPIR
jgi:hypothetical protein